MTTKIEWTAVQGADGQWHPGYTFNPWWGCVKVSEACKHCYSESFDKRVGGSHWGEFARRRRLSDAHWNKPLAWARKADRSGVRLRVFCGSMCDWLEEGAGLYPLRLRLLELIERTPELDWLMLSKRPENLRWFVPDWVEYRGGTPPNVWLGVTAETQPWADRRLPLLCGSNTPVKFVSVEPMLGPVTLRHHDVDWVIIGSESGPRARETESKWVRDLIAECKELDRPVFLKQLPKPGGRRGQVVSLPELDGRVYREQPRNTCAPSVTVCAACLRASCWQYVFPCENARTAGTTTMPIARLRALALEHESYWEGAA